MKVLFSAVVCVLLSACVSTAEVHVQAYTGAARPDAEVATLLTPVNATTFSSDAPLNGYLMKVDDQVVGGEKYLKFPSVTTLLPGARMIDAQCQLGKRRSLFSFPHVFKAGHSYVLVCKNLGNDQIAAEINDVAANGNAGK